MKTRTLLILATVGLLLSSMPTGLATQTSETSEFRYVTNGYWSEGGPTARSGQTSCGPQVWIDFAGASCGFAKGYGEARLRGTVALELTDTAGPGVPVNWWFTPLNDARTVCASGIGFDGFEAQVPDGCGMLWLQLDKRATIGTGTFTYSV